MSDITTSSTYSTSDFKLIQLNQDLLDAIEQKEPLYFSSKSNVSQLHLSTQTKTFEIQHETTSNMKLLVSTELPTENTIVAHSITTNHYTLTPKQPCVEQLRTLLLQYPYNDHDLPEYGYTFPQLQEELQQSTKQLEHMLQTIHAIELPSKYWVVYELALVEQTISQMIDVLIEQDWEVQNLTIAQFEEILDCSSALIQYCFQQCGMVQANGQWSLDSKAVAQFRAEQLLRQALPQQYPLDAFLEKWAYRLPESIETNVSYLTGLALQDGTTEYPLLTYFPASKLPMEAQARFQELFAFRSQWTLSDLEPYIEALVTTTCTQASLLLKYTRACRKNAQSSEYYYTLRT